jgi:hypothetical protein
VLCCLDETSGACRSRKGRAQRRQRSGQLEVGKLLMKDSKEYLDNNWDSNQVFQTQLTVPVAVSVLSFQFIPYIVHFSTITDTSNLASLNALQWPRSAEYSSQISSQIFYSESALSTTRRFLMNWLSETDGESFISDFRTRNNTRSIHSRLYTFGISNKSLASIRPERRILTM